MASREGPRGVPVTAGGTVGGLGEAAKHPKESRGGGSQVDTVARGTVDPGREGSRCPSGAGRLT